MLPPIDEALLTERAPGFSVTPDGGMICVLVPGLQLPPGLPPAPAVRASALPALHPADATGSAPAQPSWAGAPCG